MIHLFVKREKRYAYTVWNKVQKIESVTVKEMEKYNMKKYNSFSLKKKKTSARMYL